MKWTGVQNLLPPERGADFRMVLNYERIYRIFERSKANGHENVCDF